MKSDEIPWGMPLPVFRCRVPYFTLILCALATGGMAVFMGRQALTNKRGLILEGFELGVSGATNFNWFMALVCGAFASLMTLLMISALVRGVPDVVLQQDAISLPAGFMVKRPFVLPYSQITGLSLQTYKHQHSLILHTRIKDWSIVLNWLRGKNAEKELIQALQWHMAECQARQS